MIYNGKKYYHVFTAGTYPQGNVGEDFLNQVAANYDPANYHEAPVWIGHPDDDGTSEPEALGWIDSVIAIGNKLYVSFSHVSDKFKQLIDDGAFKRVSVELVKFKTDDGVDVPYLYAVGLTNRPAVKGLQPISFKERKTRTDYHNKILFENKFNTTMNQYLIKLAQKLGLDVSKFTSDDKLSDAIDIAADKLKDEKPEVPAVPPVSPPVPATAPDADTQVAELQKEVAELNQERVANLVDNAIEAKKILPKDKAVWENLAKTNYTAAKSALGTMSVHPSLQGKQIGSADVTGAPDISDPKFFKEGSVKYTYEEVIKDHSLMKNFNAEELALMKKERSDIFP